MTFSHFPVTIPRLFVEAFRNLGHTVWTAGVPFGNWIPWTAEGAQKEGIFLPERYAIQPTVPLNAGETYTWDAIVRLLPELPDFVLHHPVPPDPQGRFSARIEGRPHRKTPYGLLLTDPHVLEWYYKGVRYDADFVFNMQDYYKAEGDYYIPYAYAPQHHYLQMEIEHDLDAVCIGLQYPHRRAVMDELGLDGFKVVSKVGEAFDEYRALYNRAKVAFSWSSLHDTIARVFEAPRMGAALVTNWTPDLFKFFNDDEVTIFRSSAREAVDACKRLIGDNAKRREIVRRGYKAMLSHTYEDRCQRIITIIQEQTYFDHHNRALDEWLDGLKEARRAIA